MIEPDVYEMSYDDIDQLKRRAREHELRDDDYEKLARVAGAYQSLIGMLADKGITLDKLGELRGLSLSRTTEKTSAVCGDDANADASESNEAGDSEDVAADDKDGETGDDDPEPDGDADDKTKRGKRRRKGNGRTPASAYVGARNVTVEHTHLKLGDPCPESCGGKLYAIDPSKLVRLTGSAPIAGVVIEQKNLRCATCGVVYPAELPASVACQKYDPSAVAMIALLRYGTGMPFNRLEGLQKSVGIPLASSTQWDLCNRAHSIVEPVFDALVESAAQGSVFFNDDTGATILSLRKETASEAKKADGLPPSRTGMRTTGIVSMVDGQPIALYFTGRKIAGENLADVLSHRDLGLPPPILMCDGSSHNTPKDFEVILANCIPHGRRKFVNIIDSFPEQCRFVLSKLRDVYVNERFTREHGLSDEERLRYHQQHSSALMDELWQWCAEVFENRSVEPNSALGRAITYMTKRKDKLTLFLREPGAPLDNNICERILKKAIMHRKNSLFFKTRNGAAVGDHFISLIHTAELFGIDPLRYLTALLENADAVQANPADWLPGVYESHYVRQTRAASA